MKVILQDDAAPDSLESFEKDFFIATGYTLQEFKKVAFCVPCRVGYLWKYRNFHLEWYYDDPFYQLIDQGIQTNRPCVVSLYRG